MVSVEKKKKVWKDDFVIIQRWRGGTAILSHNRAPLAQVLLQDTNRVQLQFRARSWVRVSLWDLLLNLIYLSRRYRHLLQRNERLGCNCDTDTSPSRRGQYHISEIKSTWQGKNNTFRVFTCPCVRKIFSDFSRANGIQKSDWFWDSASQLPAKHPCNWTIENTISVIIPSLM